MLDISDVSFKSEEKHQNKSKANALSKVCHVNLDVSNKYM